MRRFKRRTNWIVFTGPALSGKSTLLKMFEDQGVRCVREVARSHFDEETRRGIPISEIRRDEAEFQRTVMAKKLAIEMALPAHEHILFDRGLPDSISYYRNAGMKVTEVIPLCQEFQYSMVFMFEPLPYLQDRVRTETPVEMKRIQRWLYEDYVNLGYNPTWVPAMSIDERFRYVSGRIAKYVSD